MPNKNYVKGRKKEYTIVWELRDAGYAIVQRSAGSHSPIDVFAIRESDKTILLIQSKPDNYPAHHYDKWKWLNGTFTVKFEVR